MNWRQDRTIQGIIRWTFARRASLSKDIRAVCGLPLGKTDLLKPGMMVNLLGDEVKLVEEDPELLKRQSYIYTENMKSKRPQNGAYYIYEAT